MLYGIQFLSLVQVSEPIRFTGVRGHHTPLELVDRSSVLQVLNVEILVAVLVWGRRGDLMLCLAVLKRRGGGVKMDAIISFL